MDILGIVQLWPPFGSGAATATPVGPTQFASTAFLDGPDPCRSTAEPA